LKTHAHGGTLDTAFAQHLRILLDSLVSTFDKVLAAPERAGPLLSFPSGSTTAREIIEARVRVEVQRFNAGEETPKGNSLFAPTDAEGALNGARRDRRTKLDIGEQIDRALDAVRMGRVIVLFNGTQVSDIDRPLAMTPVSEARFVRLVALVGG
jgi:hypothetical protein